MLGRPVSFRSTDTLGQAALRAVGSLCFAAFVAGVLAFTIIAATYRPADPLLASSPSTASSSSSASASATATSRLTSFLTSTSSATFRSDRDSALRTGEDFLNSSSAADSTPAIRLYDIETDENNDAAAAGNCEGPIDCRDREVFHVMMRAAIEAFPAVHFYRFGKPAPGADGGGSCDMAWHFRPKDAHRAGFYKDYRRFQIARSADCTFSVAGIGDYHSGVNARKRRKKPVSSAGDGDAGFEPKKAKAQPGGDGDNVIVPIVGDAVTDALPAVESEAKFRAGRYLVYSGGGDRCKSMNHYLWSLLCALGEAQYLNRTLVMDLNICLSSMYTPSNQDEEGKDFRFYFDLGHLRDSASVVDQRQFWKDWARWREGGLGLHVVEDFRVTPMKLAWVKDPLVMRKFGAVEPDNYWYRVCEGETESVIQRPWHLIWKSPHLMDIVSGIASRLNWDFDSVHVVRGEKANDTKLWPNLMADTSPEALLSTLRGKIDGGREVYIATNEPDTSFFDPLKKKYRTHFLDDFKDMWGETSEWYLETQKLNSGIPVEFDGYMRVEVDTEVFLRGKKQIETFNDLTRDCKDGINTCQSSS